MGVRPRTKEFLIGYPMMLILLYFGYSFKMYPVLLMGLIGQISLINTYAHIHTPPVSYTHLDVYKRQSKPWSESG